MTRPDAHAPLSVDDARVLCRLIDETVEDLSDSELAAWDRLCEACGYVEWMRERIAANRAEEGMTDA